MLCLIVGGMGPLLPSPFNLLFYGWSCYLQVLVLLTLHGYFNSMKRKLRSPHDQSVSRGDVMAPLARECFEPHQVI